MTYQLTGGSDIVLDDVIIPADPHNTDYQKYLEWVAGGGVPSPYVAPRPIIPSISPRQCRLALNAAGLRDAVEAYVAGASQDIKDTWEFATVIERNNPIISTAATQLGLTEEQVDSLFITAAAIP